MTANRSGATIALEANGNQPPALLSNEMVSFWNLLRDNRNYRYIWLGQIVSEVGDHFNSIAV